MKKAGIIIPVVLTIAVILACTLPSSVEIKGTPEGTIPVGMEISSSFKKIIKESIPDTEDMTILLCDRTEIMTMALYREIIGDDVEEEIQGALREAVSGLLESGQFIDDLTDEQWDLIPETTSEELLSNNDDEPITVSLKDVANFDFLEGFVFRDIPAKMYMYGTESLINSLSITISGINSDDINLSFTGKSDFEKAKTPSGECSWVTLPSNGAGLNLKDVINKKDDLKIKYEVSLKKGVKFKKEWFTNMKIRAEMAALIPLDFVVDPNYSEATLKLDNASGSDDKEDMFGRKAGADSSTTDMIQSLELSIGLNPNPFHGANLVVRSDKGKDIIEIRTPTNSSAINLDFDEAAMKKINDPANIPFVPKISFVFDRNGALTMPRKLETTNISFKAKILQKINLDGNG